MFFDRKCFLSKKVFFQPPPEPHPQRSLFKGLLGVTATSGTKINQKTIFQLAFNICLDLFTGYLHDL